MKNPQISLQKITKKYETHTVLNQVNLEIDEGDFICIFGKSGGGKTTLLNIIGTLEEYDTGKLIVSSYEDPIKNEKTCELLRREKIAYLFQNFALIETMTVEENMKLAVKYSKEKNKKDIIESTLDDMGILHTLKSKVYTLSGGEQQRLAMARNMVKPYEIMLADEPTGSLDDENKRKVMDTLVDINHQGKTVVVVSHDNDFKHIAKRICVIQKGTLKEVYHNEK